MYVFDFGYNVKNILKKKELGIKECEKDRETGKEIILEKFPDGENYVRVIQDVENEKVIVVKSVYNNEELINTFLILDALKKGGAKKIYLVMPYLVYMRQDKIFKKGEALSAEFVLKEFKNFADEIFLVNPHIPFNYYGYSKYKGIKFYGIDASTEIAKYFKNLKNIKIIAPDDGSINLTKRVADILTCEWNYCDKIRKSGTEVEIEEKNLGIEGKDVLIVDDIISTGGTLIKTIKIVEKQNPKSINIACIHGVFCDKEKLEKLKQICNLLVCTNSIPTEENKDLKKIDISNVIANGLMEYIEF